MKQELKQKVLDAIVKLEENDIVKENVYKCTNDGMVCFNGFVAELINGNKYDLDNYWDIAYERATEAAEEYLLEDVKNDLQSWEHWDDLSSQEQERLIDIHYDTALENYEPEVDSSELGEYIADEITEDLDKVYDSVDTLRDINELHYSWINGSIDFDLAIAELERIFTNQE